jgi:penicillin-binding protein 1B
MLSELAPVTRVLNESGEPAFGPDSKPNRILSPQVAFMITSLLQSVIDEGTGAGARATGFVLPAAGKTGTSRDGWFAGYTPDLLCIVWVGFDDNRELNLSGAQSALPIWASFMKKATLLRPLSGERFPVAEGITEVDIDPGTGLLATAHCLVHKLEYFIKGTEPVIACYGDDYDRMGSDPRSIYSTPDKGTDNAGSDSGTKPPQPDKTTPDLNPPDKDPAKLPLDKTTPDPNQKTTTPNPPDKDPTKVPPDKKPPGGDDKNVPPPVKK